MSTDKLTFATLDRPQVGKRISSGHFASKIIATATPDNTKRGNKLTATQIENGARAQNTRKHGKVLQHFNAKGALLEKKTLDYLRHIGSAIRVVPPMLTTRTT